MEAPTTVEDLPHFVSRVVQTSCKNAQCTEYVIPQSILVNVKSLFEISVVGGISVGWGRGEDLQCVCRDVYLVKPGDTIVLPILYGQKPVVCVGMCTW